jgi:hypothetical protein
MENVFMDPEAKSSEFQVPYDIVDLPSQGLLYTNKQKTVTVEYLTALDETILTSPNILNNDRVTDVLISRKVKNLGFNSDELLEGDRTAILLFLRVTGFGPDYAQMVFDLKSSSMVEGNIDLSTLKQKKLTINPDSDGLFDYELPDSKKRIKFRFLTGKDEKEIEERDAADMERSGDGISKKIIYKLEKQISSIDGITDKIKISNIIKNLTILESRKLRKYINDIEPGIDFKVSARTPGGGSVDTFLRFNTSFFWPEL